MFWTFIRHRGYPHKPTPSLTQILWCLIAAIICTKCSTLQCSNFTATSRYYSKHIHHITSESKCRNLRETVEMSQSDVLLQCCVVCGEMRESLWLAGDGGAPAPECEGAQSSSVFTELSWGKQVQQQHKSVVIISDKVWHQLMMNN